MPDDDRNTVAIPLLDMFKNFTKQLDGLETRVMAGLDKLTRQIETDRAQSTRRLEELENWRIRHESGEGHPAVVAELRSCDKRLDALEQETRDAKAREEALKDQQAARDKRINIRIAVAGVLVTVGVILATVVAPSLVGR